MYGRSKEDGKQVKTECNKATHEIVQREMSDGDAGGGDEKDKV